MAKFNSEQANYMVEVYTSVNSDSARTEAVEKLAEEYDVSTKSIIGKLVREGVYQAQTPKNTNSRIDKEEYVLAIKTMVGAPINSLSSLSSMSGKDLVTLSQCLINLSNQQEFKN